MWRMSFKKRQLCRKWRGRGKGDASVCEKKAPVLGKGKPGPQRWPLAGHNWTSAVAASEHIPRDYLTDLLPHEADLLPHEAARRVAVSRGDAQEQPPTRRRLTPN